MKRINSKAFFISALSLFSLNGFASSVECDTLVTNGPEIYTDRMHVNSFDCDYIKTPTVETSKSTIYCNLSLKGSTSNRGIDACSSYPTFNIWRSTDARGGNFLMAFDTTQFNIRCLSGEGYYNPIRFTASTYTFDFGRGDGENGERVTDKVMTVNGKIVCNEELKVVEINTEKIRAKEMNVEMNQAADYVFDENYDLKSLDEVESYVKQNKHLPGVPSADEFSDKGMNVSQMSNLLLEKVEELTLHMIQMRKEMDMLKEENSSLKEEINQLRKK